MSDLLERQVLKYEQLGLSKNDPQIFIFKQYIMIPFGLVNVKQFVETSKWRVLYPLNQVAPSIFACVDKTHISGSQKKIRVRNIQVMKSFNTWYLQRSYGLK